MVDFRRYHVWQKAHELALLTYCTLREFPTDEKFGLTAQIRRSVTSIPTNIAEGCGRYGDKDRARLFDIARGSASEVEYQLMLSRDLEYLEGTTFEELNGLVIEVKKLLSSLISCLRGTDQSSPRKADS